METDGQKMAPVAAHDMDLLLCRVELLLTLAEGIGTPGAIDQRDSSYREAVGRMLRWASTLRAQASADAAAMVKGAQKEKARVAAEIEVLRAERDLCMAMAAEASSAVSTQLVKWQSLESGTPGNHHPDGSIGDSTGPRSNDDSYPRGLGGAEIKEGATRSTGTITLTVDNVPDLATLMRIEEAVEKLPSVATSSVTSFRGGLGTIEVGLGSPVSPLMLAVEMVASLGHPVPLDAVAEQHIAARYKP